MFLVGALMLLSALLMFVISTKAKPTEDRAELTVHDV
jgi:hypothetical protein